MPPDYPGIPGLAMHRPPASNPAPAELASVEAERPSLVDFKESVRIHHGRTRIVIPWVVVAALITAGGTYYGTRRSPDDPGPLLQEFRLEVQTARAERSKELEGINTRLGGIETQLTVMKATSDSTNQRITDLSIAVHGSSPPGGANISVSNALRGH